MFERERHAVDVTYGGKEYRLYARELAHIYFQELCSAKYPEPRGVNILCAVAVACLESEDGNPAFTMDTWRDAPRAVAEPLSMAAMKAQGIDDSEEKEKPEPAPGKG